MHYNIVDHRKMLKSGDLDITNWLLSRSKKKLRKKKINKVNISIRSTFVQQFGSLIDFKHMVRHAKICPSRQIQSAFRDASAHLFYSMHKYSHKNHLEYPPSDSRNRYEQ